MNMSKGVSSYKLQKDGDRDAMEMALFQKYEVFFIKK